jgi:beta-glucosidase
VVVLETGTPVLMPWLDQVGAVLEAWYPGTRGGEAIARILYGEVNPSGRLPISFPTGVETLVRPEIPGQIFGPPVEGKTLPTSDPNVQQHKGRFSVEHPEGADVGYRWFASQGTKTLFPFGHGLSYTRFAYAGLSVTGGGNVEVSFDVTNAGDRAGVDTPQVYATVTDANGKPSRRLIGWARVDLAPGETKRVTVSADPRLLANYDATLPGWRITAGSVEIAVATSAEDAGLKASAVLEARRIKP